MFRGRQHGDVLDALVIGLAGLVVVRHIGHLSALGFHARFLQKRVGGERSERQKKTAGIRRWVQGFRRCLRLNLSTANEA
jgi:hypothetical protein